MEQITDFWSPTSLHSSGGRSIACPAFERDLERDGRQMRLVRHDMEPAERGRRRLDQVVPVRPARRLDRNGDLPRDRMPRPPRAPGRLRYGRRVVDRELPVEHAHRPARGRSPALLQFRPRFVQVEARLVVRERRGMRRRRGEDAADRRRPALGLECPERDGAPRVEGVQQAERPRVRDQEVEGCAAGSVDAATARRTEPRGEGPRTAAESRSSRSSSPSAGSLTPSA